MNNQVNDNNIQAVAGGALGTSSKDEISNTIFIQNHSLVNLGLKTYGAINHSLSTTVDNYRSPKYAVDSNVSYYSGGAISLFEKLGKFVFTKTVNNNNRGALRIDQTNSSFYSSADQTTLGSTDISTVDGWMINPTSLTFPSANYSPTKPWIKKLFPTITESDILTFVILEIIQQALKDPVTEEPKDYRITKDRKDLGAIIVDNQEIEDKLFLISKGT